MSICRNEATLVRIPALGRHFRLGMLYNIYSHTILAEPSLWSADAVEEKKRTVWKQETDCQTLLHDDVGDKCQALDMDANMRLAYLCGLLEVGGAAKFLDDHKTARLQARVSLKYRCTNRLEQFEAAQMDKPETSDDVLVGAAATHVVVGIRYGAHAFFVFDHNLNTDEDGTQAADNLRDLVNALRRRFENTSCSAALGKQEIDIANNVKCQYHGDLSLKMHPKSVQDVAYVSQVLEKMFGENGANAVPLEVYLHPLSFSDDQMMEPKLEVSQSLAEEVEAFFQKLHDAEMECTDLLRSPICQHLQAVERKICSFREAITEYALMNKRLLSATLSNSTEGSSLEGELLEILRSREISPFSDKELARSLADHANGVKFWADLTASLGYVEFLTKSTLIFDLMRSDTEILVCLMINLNGEDNQAENRERYLVSKQSSGAAYMPLKTMTPVITMTAAQNAKRFKDFVHANRDTPGLVFRFVEDAETTAEKGAFIDVYQDGNQMHSNYCPPSRPGRPVTKENHQDKLVMTWKKPSLGIEDVEHYEVSYQPDEEATEEWTTVQTDEASNTIVLTALQAACPYRVRVRAVVEIGFSPYSEVATLSTCPKTISSDDTSAEGSSTTRTPSTEVSSATDKAASGDSNTADGAECDIWCDAEDDPDKWMSLGQSSSCDAGPQTYNDLLGQRTQPHGRMLQDYTAGMKDRSMRQPVQYGSNKQSKHGMAAGAADTVTATQRLKDRVLSMSQRVENIDLQIPIYQVRLATIFSERQANIRKYAFGYPVNGVSEKVMLVVGATGAGKTTLINGMFNYVVGVDFEDEYRFNLVEENQATADQAESQTRHITAYTLNHQEGFTIPYTLTIVDTPGFGDVEGIKRDQQITEQIHKFFTTTGDGGIDHIDAVGFVTPASLPRLTHTQRYVFDSILSLFGNDIKRNIFLMVTFADGNKPPVLAAVTKSQIDYQDHYKFNNSALYIAPTRAQTKGNYERQFQQMSFDELFWSMGEESYRAFLNNLHRVQPTSLQLTQIVLEERHRLENYVIEVNEDIQLGLSKLDQLRREAMLLKAHEADIERNKNFTYEVTETSVEKQDLARGLHTTTCLTCNRTCHRNCAFADDKDKFRCSSMREGKCIVCVKKCSWDIHKNVPYLLVAKKKVVRKTYDSLKTSYQKAMGQALTAKDVVQAVTNEFVRIQMKVLSMTDNVRCCIERLNQIALKPNPLSMLEYIDILIQSEKNEARLGWQERVAELQRVRKRADCIQKLQIKGHNPFAKYESLLQELDSGKYKKKGTLDRLTDYIKNLFSGTQDASISFK